MNGRPNSEMKATFQNSPLLYVRCLRPRVRIQHTGVLTKCAYGLFCLSGLGIKTKVIAYAE